MLNFVFYWPFIRIIIGFSKVVKLSWFSVYAHLNMSLKLEVRTKLLMRIFF